MASGVAGRVGILWRGDRDRASEAVPPRLRPIFDALTALNIDPEAVVYSYEAASDVRDQLLRLDGVLVWVDPITGEHDRSVLDAMLRAVSSRGTWVSAHPDVILKMGTKEVIFRTRQLGWGTDTQIYASFDEFARQFPACLSSSGPRVLKQNRGNGGIGVWKVEVTSASDATTVTHDTVVRVQHAEKRDAVTEDLRLGTFVERCRRYFDSSGLLVDQAFQPRLLEGMIRCYMIQDAVAGFAHQSPSSPDQILGLPAAKTMFPETAPRFQVLKRNMESEWLPGMRRLLDLDRGALPLLWDADFLYGAKTAEGEDTYVLCEINVSCVSPFPDTVPSLLAQAVQARLLS
ncbi:MAG: Cj0069 family protein [Chloroflexota bacterium]|nr:Cj0069 family protein [Chloroflexota bacterium]